MHPLIIIFLTLFGVAVLLWLCSDYMFKGYYWGEYLLSPFISFECAVLVNFALANFAVFPFVFSVKEQELCI